MLEIQDVEKRKDYFRYKMMEPFKQMWHLINVPLKAKQQNGYDVVMASKMLGFADVSDERNIREGLSILEENNAYTVAERTIKNCRKVIQVLAEYRDFTEQLGPWVTSMDKEELEYSMDVIGKALDVKGFAEVSSYMFGDEIAVQEGYQPVGLPFCAGYAVGYKAVQNYMEKHNKTIYEATLTSTDEIINGCDLFT